MKRLKNAPPDSFLTELRDLFPSDRLFEDDTRLAPYESDGLTVFRQKPLAVTLPVNQDEVVSAVRLCHKHGIPFVARGSGTSLSGGSLPVEGGIIIGLNRLNRILTIDPENRTATVEPGVINIQVSEAAKPHGLYFAPDPSSQSVCTIGGNVAFNSGGAHCLKYGMTANHVVSIKVVIPDGDIVLIGEDSWDASGPDLAGFYVGNEGLFGVALEIKLRLIPLPETYKTVLAAYPDLESAGEAVGQVVSSGILPSAMEIMDRLALDAAEAAVGAKYPSGAAAIMIVELDGEETAVKSEFSILMECIDATGATEIQIAANAQERALIWKGRKSAFSAVGRLSPDFIVQDGVVPRSRLGEALRAIQDLSKRYHLRVANVFHAGDGNLHPLILFDGKMEGALEKAEELAAQIIQLCLNLGGSITGEHGVGMEKRQFMPDMFSPIEMDIFRQLRSAIDPKEISNRGKMFPDGEAPSLKQTGMHPLEKAGIISRE